MLLCNVPARAERGGNLTPPHLTFRTTFTFSHYGALRHAFPTLRQGFPKPCGSCPSPSSRACRDQGGQRRAIRPFRAPWLTLSGRLRAARADPRVHLPMRRRRSWSCSSTPASPAGGAGTARPRPSEREPEVIFVVLSVRSRRAVGTHVSPAMWQPIFFTNDGAALHLCLPVLACERAC